MNAKQPCGCGQAGCGCCEGIDLLTPRLTANRPGLSTLAYRVGTHASFFETMKARLTTHSLRDEKGGQFRPLAALRTRDGSDPAIAFLDAWATVADVLTFYQERIANEGYLRTAMERRSVQELARLIGYAPRPGVAASTYLAYTIDENTNEQVLIPQGTRVQSVPGPGEFPQSFETSEDLLARVGWNELKPRTMQPQRFDSVLENGALYLSGVSTILKPGDPLLMVEEGKEPLLLRITTIDAELESDRTRIGIESWRAVIDPDVERMVKLLEAAPEGKTAARVVEALQPIRDHAAQSSGPIPRSIADRAREHVLEAEAGLGNLPAPKLREWLATVKSDLRSAASDLEADGQPQGDSLATRIAALTKSRSQPRSTALQLPRSIESNFGKTSDAGLQVIGAVAPGLRDSIGPVLTGTVKAGTATTLKVYAFRVRTGVFGRQAPKRQRVVRSSGENGTETKVIGEWPIVEFDNKGHDDVGGNIVANSYETTKIIYLESSRESVLPGSWIVVDSSAVPIYDGDEAVMVRPAGETSTERVLVTTIAEAHANLARAEYGMSGESTRLKLREPWLRFIGFTDESGAEVAEAAAGSAARFAQTQPMIDRDFQVIRSTTVFAQSEELDLAQEPFEPELCDGTTQPIELDGVYQDLQPGRFVVFSGERSDLGEDTLVVAAEPLMISDVVHDVRSADTLGPWHDVRKGGDAPGAQFAQLPGDRVHTFLYFDRPLSHCYRRSTVTILGNVVKATHGETHNESLGNGDGAKSLQEFKIKRWPLTYLAAPTAVGAESTLHVYVNDVRWKETSTFVDGTPTDRIFGSKTDDEGKTSIVFGNGREGARLPTGIENVKATYRSGIGKAGNVRAGQLTTLATRPLGVKEVVNPLGASGGADPEARDQVRHNAPTAVIALDRLVSTRDYADFARTFAGIAKAEAVEFSDGRRNVVHVTIAGTDDIPIDTGSDLFINLCRALRDLGDAFQPIEVATRELLLLVLEAQIRILPDFRWESVVAEVRGRLLDAFGFERRELAQDVTSSEVVTVIHSVRGVAYVDFDVFGAVASMKPDELAASGRRPLTPEETSVAVHALSLSNAPPHRVRARPAGRDGDAIRAAELAILVPDIAASLVLNQLK